MGKLKMQKRQNMHCEKFRDKNTGLEISPVTGGEDESNLTMK